MPLELEALKELFQSISDGILVTDNTQKILYSNDAGRKFTGFTTMDLQTMYLAELMEALPVNINEANECANNILIKHRNGTSVPMYMTAVRYMPAVQFSIFIFRKSTNDLDLMSKMEILAKVAYLDPITTTYTRTYAEIKFKQATPNEKKGLLLVNVKNLKSFNENYGTEVGDSILRKIGVKLVNMVTEDDFVARWQSSTFMMTVTGGSKGKIVLLSEKIKADVSTGVIIVGVVNRDKETIAEMIDRAEKALYQKSADGIIIVE